jgi:1-acyl-sn-glycerol-3-phosphate acyltransferase
MTTIAQRATGATIRTAARLLAARDLVLTVEGEEHLPPTGPLLIVARHHHHLYDGVALLAAVPRLLHLLVALDWARTGVERAVLEWATRSARWPGLLRQDALEVDASVHPTPRRSAYCVDEVPRYRLRAIREAVALLVEGAALVVFPEGYPNVDPRWTPKRRPDEMLPFRPGFALVARLARQRTGVEVPIVPAGLTYRPGPRWETMLRFGAPLTWGMDTPAGLLAQAAHRRVAALSRPVSLVSDDRPADARRWRGDVAIRLEDRS